MKSSQTRRGAWTTLGAGWTALLGAAAFARIGGDALWMVPGVLIFAAALVFSFRRLANALDAGAPDGASAVPFRAAPPDGTPASIIEPPMSSLCVGRWHERTSIRPSSTWALTTEPSSLAGARGRTVGGLPV